MTRTYIVGAKRTPQGRFLGSLAKLSPVDLAMAAGNAAMDEAGLDREHVEEVVVGHVLSAGHGNNIARQIGVGMKLPIHVPAYTVNLMCGSGLLAVALAHRAIVAGVRDVVLCGGTESMSNAAYLLPRARGGYKLGHGQLVDSMLSDALVDSFGEEHMAMTAERLAQENEITREAQDDYAARSQQRCAAAQGEGVFAREMVAVGGLDHDEHVRGETTAAGLASLKPAFDPTGSVTAGNASGINDGAAMLVVCSQRAAERYGWEPLAEFCGATEVGCDPARMGLGPVWATRALCEKAGEKLSDFDQVELNEAFAAQTLACLKQLGMSVDDARVNPYGGAIAMGHPVGASGARLITHLAQQIGHGKIRNGLASLCVGGGMGVAAMLRRV